MDVNKLGPFNRKTLFLEKYVYLVKKPKFIIFDDGSELYFIYFRFMHLLLLIYDDIDKNLGEQ